MGYRDKAWSVNRLGHVAYKCACAPHSLPASALPLKHCAKVHSSIATSFAVITGHPDPSHMCMYMSSLTHPANIATCRHGCPDVCITIINNMYGYNAMEVQEAFVKIREQARAYLALPHDLRAGVPPACVCVCGLVG
jgi:hypothetical protein